MKRERLVLSALMGAFLLSSGYAFAADPEPVRNMAQEQVYGSQLMTQQERLEYRDRMRAAKTAEEREQIRREHHEQMTERAKARGVTLPDDPPSRGGGRGPSGGMGPSGGGMGPSGGMGAGGGMGRGGGRGR